MVGSVHRLKFGFQRKLDYTPSLAGVKASACARLEHVRQRKTRVGGVEGGRG
jgi:hypothetical protein